MIVRVPSLASASEPRSADDPVRVSAAEAELGAGAAGAPWVGVEGGPGSAPLGRRTAGPLLGVDGAVRPAMTRCTLGPALFAVAAAGDPAEVAGNGWADAVRTAGVPLSSAREARVPSAAVMPPCRGTARCIPTGCWDDVPPVAAGMLVGTGSACCRGTARWIPTGWGDDVLPVVGEVLAGAVFVCAGVARGTVGCEEGVLPSAGGALVVASAGLEAACRGTAR